MLPKSLNDKDKVEEGKDNKCNHQTKTLTHFSTKLLQEKLNK